AARRHVAAWRGGEEPGRAGRAALGRGGSREVPGERRIRSARPRPDVAGRAAVDGGGVGQVSLLTPELKARVGEEARYSSPDELGRTAIRYFALAVGDLNPLYLDEDFARAHGHPSVIAPPTLVCETNQFVPGERDADGYLTQMFE